MKMADGGFRPAYNVQVTSVAGEQIVVGLKVTNTGSDRGLMRPMLERQHTRPGGLPKRYLVDGGFGSAEDIEWAHAEGVEVFCPPTQIQARHRSLPAATRRRPRRTGMARANGERRGQGPIQAPVDLRMHPCPLAQLGPAAIDRARH